MPGRQACDAVIGLAALGNDHFHPEDADQLLERLYLGNEPFRSRRAVCLVCRKDLVPEMRAVPVQDEGEVLRTLLPQDLQQHPPHDVQGSRGKPIGTGHVGVGKKTAEEERVAVHDVQRVSFQPETLPQ